MTSECKDESCLEFLKGSYEELRKKNDLPTFEELNQDFSIEKVATLETDCLAREIRKIISEILSNQLRFVEAILQPSNASMFVFSFIKSINNGEKEKLNQIYTTLSKLGLDLVRLDLKFSEEDEINFIKKAFKEWQIIKEDLSKILKIVKDNWDNKVQTNGKNYFG